MKGLLLLSLIITAKHFTFCCYCQTVELVMPSFQYLYDKGVSPTGKASGRRVVMFLSDSMQTRMNQSIERALKERWNLSLGPGSWSIKPIPAFSMNPKIRDRIKAKQPGKWYLFLLLVDDINYLHLASYDARGIYTSTIKVKARLVDGGMDSTILEREFNVDVYKSAPPDDQISLNRLCASPKSYVQGFDSIASWIFQANTPLNKYLTFKPACEFHEVSMETNAISSTLFEHSTPDGIIKANNFSLQPLPGKSRKVGVKKNALGNTASGLVTILTGVGTSKSKLYHYEMDYPFKEADFTYHCLINYHERESAERTRETTKENGEKSYSVSSGSSSLDARFIDSNDVHTITLADDTVATFHIQYQKCNNCLAAYSRMWDGSDSSTITALEPAWDNTERELDVIITGTAIGEPFMIKTSKERRIKEVYVNDKLCMIISGNEKPIKADFFENIPPTKLKIFTIISSIPHSFLNYTPSYPY